MSALQKHDLRRLALWCAGRGLGAGRAARVLIIDRPDRGIERRHGEHHRDQEPEQLGRPAVVLDDRLGLPGGQQEGTGSNGEPSGGLIPEAGQLLAPGLGVAVRTWPAGTLRSSGSAACT